MVLVDDTLKGVLQSALHTLMTALVRRKELPLLMGLCLLTSMGRGFSISVTMFLLFGLTSGAHLV